MRWLNIRFMIRSVIDISPRIFLGGGYTPVEPTALEIEIRKCNSIFAFTDYSIPIHHSHRFALYFYFLSRNIARRSTLQYR